MSANITILFMLFFAFHVNGRNNHLSSSCTSSYCGDLEIRYPFRLTTDPTFCQRSGTKYHDLDCQSNQAIFNLSSMPFGVYVKEIYKDQRMRVVDPRTNKLDLSSCPKFTLSARDRLYFDVDNGPAEVAYIHCLSPMSSTKYIKSPFCGERSSMTGNFSKAYSYVFVGESVLDLEESCTVDRVVGWVSPMNTYTSLRGIYDELAYGFLTWYGITYTTDSCELVTSFEDWFAPYTRSKYDYIPYLLKHIGVIRVRRCCHNFYKATPEKCVGYSVMVRIAISAAFIVVGFTILKFMIGFPLMIWSVVHKWRRRHLCMDKTIEEFLRGQQNLAPINYTYSEIKKMTDNFTQKLGEGGCGTVYIKESSEVVQLLQ